MIVGGTHRALLAAASGVAFAGVLVLSGPSRVVVPIGAEARTATPARVTGVHASERQYGRLVRWTDGRARIEWPRVVGLQPVAVELSFASFPGRTGDQVTITVNDTHVSRHAMSGDWDVVSVPVPEATGALTIDVWSLTHHAPGDPRTLGVRLDTMTLHNGGLATTVTAATAWQVLMLVLAGALTFVVAASGAGRVSVGLGAVAALALVLWWGRLWSLQSDSLRALGATLALGGIIHAVLVHGGTPRRQAMLTAAGASLPFLVLAALIVQHFVDVPRWDVWELVPLIERQREGTLTFGDLWHAHNAHRPLTGRVLLLANVMLTRWNHWYDLAMLLTAGALQLVVLASFVARTQRRTASVHPAGLVVAAWFVFTLVQWENWLQGWQVLLLAGALSVSAALLVLAEGETSWSRTALAATLGLCGTASFASCLLVWPLGAAAIGLRQAPGWRRQFAAWLVLSAAAVAAYMWGLPPDPSAGPEAFALTWLTVRRLVAGVLVSVAMPALYRPGAFAGPAGPLEWAMVATGAAACALAALTTYRRWRDDRARETTWLFPVLLVLFGLGAGALAALGRAWGGVQSMTASRYVVFGACVWTGLVLLLAIRGPVVSTTRRWGTIALLLVIAMAAADNWRFAMPHIEAHYLSSSQARAWLRRDDIHAAASVLYPDPAVLEARTEILRKYHLSLYRPGAR